MHVVNNVKQATSVIFHVDTTGEASNDTVKVSYGHEMKTYIQGHLLRGELSHWTKNDLPIENQRIVAYILNTQTKQSLYLDPSSKTADFVSDAELSSEFQVDPISCFSELSEADAEFVDEEPLNGKSTWIYKLKKWGYFKGLDFKREGEFLKVWVDPDTQLPVQILLKAHPTPTSRFMCTELMTDFQWNAQLDPQLFSMEVPEGYTVTDSSEAPKKTVE
jgi:hypothetical protein